jgi:hypothetical protein
VQCAPACACTGRCPHIRIGILSCILDGGASRSLGMAKSARLFHPPPGQQCDATRVQCASSRACVVNLLNLCMMVGPATYTMNYTTASENNGRRRTLTSSFLWCRFRSCGSGPNEQHTIAIKRDVCFRTVTSSVLQCCFRARVFGPEPLDFLSFVCKQSF